MKQETKDFAFLHLIVLIWGFTAILGLLIEVPPVELVFFRTALSAIGLLFIILIGRHSFLINRGKDLFNIVFVGFLIAAHWILFFLAARLSNASVCLAGMATCSLWTSLLEPLYFRKKAQPFELVLGFIAFIGILIIFNVEFQYVVGFLVAVLSAFLSAWFTVINAGVTKKYDHFVITFYEMAFACLCIVLFFPLYTLYFTDKSLMLIPSGMDWFYLLILALVCTVFAYSYSIKLMRRISAFGVNLAVNMEPVYGILLALLIFGQSEAMSAGFYGGTLLILLSVLLYPILNRRFRRKPLETDILR